MPLKFLTNVKNNHNGLPRVSWKNYGKIMRNHKLSWKNYAQSSVNVLNSFSKALVKIWGYFSVKSDQSLRVLAARLLPMKSLSYYLVHKSGEPQCDQIT